MAITYNTSIVKDGLVLHLDAANVKSYPGTGTTWFDLRGNGNNGTLVNGVGYDDNNKGTMIFDGTNDFISINQDVLLETNFTITFTFLMSENRGDWVRLVGHSNDSVLRYWGIWMPSDRSYLLWQSYQNGGQISFPSFNFQLNTPYNISLSSSGSLRSLYINGEFFHSANTGNIINYDSNTSKIQIGYAGFHTYHKGYFYNLLIHNKTLTAQEIQQNFNALRGRYGI